MAREVFNLLQKEILGRTRYGVEVEEKPGSVKITVFSLRRLCHLFDQFEDCGEFIKQLGEKERDKPSSYSVKTKKE